MIGKLFMVLKAATLAPTTPVGKAVDDDDNNNNNNNSSSSNSSSSNSNISSNSSSSSSSSSNNNNNSNSSNRNENSTTKCLLLPSEVKTDCPCSYVLCLPALVPSSPARPRPSPSSPSAALAPGGGHGEDVPQQLRHHPRRHRGGRADRGAGVDLDQPGAAGGKGKADV